MRPGHGRKFVIAVPLLTVAVTLVNSVVQVVRSRHRLETDRPRRRGAARQVSDVVELPTEGHTAGSIRRDRRGRRLQTVVTGHARAVTLVAVVVVVARAARRDVRPALVPFATGRGAVAMGVIISGQSLIGPVKVAG